MYTHQGELSMCGIVGAVAERNVVEILLEGLKRLEYRGYDSAGVALLSPNGDFSRVRRTGKVQALADAITSESKPTDEKKFIL